MSENKLPNVFVVFEIGKTCPKKYVRIESDNWDVRMWNSLVGWHDYAKVGDETAAREYASGMVFVEVER